MADQLSRKPSRLVPFFLCALIAYSPSQTHAQSEGCAASVDGGQPILFQRGHLIWGLSTRPASPGEKLLVLLWFYNPSDAPVSVWTCADIDHFWEREIEVFDSAGKRILSRAEEKRLVLKEQHPDWIFDDTFACFRNFPITIPPHSCLHGSFSAPQYDFARDLNGYYLLPSGRYSLVPVKNRKTEQPSGSSTVQAVELPITVLEPLR